ncbi:MAG: ABC transporter substrate-binding protein [Chelatococcus sp.]|jgi:NitT/TauT family transport system substrate-binding protein|uniref:ABC transporter substrate-binding protein n=1 Tax=unclassified Chelatococcus TaxID=2638111 RepID=UPI001BD0494B|nr:MULTISPECIES: ABC transporter substrate-binding protein [unclassified Chelatococcus]CAH1658253.1 NitT/TauT family transport system substrate-binding protein [Hyphomicrobiales bacterium]MBS7742197.1 ABC transporter substrate-binding protein [Chelatococcus sp. HY11]MBX3539151.1 ABC transporter substrate-binding protein [Chelatococcus sp.]MBX3542685.1 ABC transporter substrate-binding protein [Chelatococcus sp.]MCO5075099.1 ABC transporter substrate-binding protein [Chelatococcus sp.]
MLSRRSLLAGTAAAGAFGLTGGLARAQGLTKATVRLAFNYNGHRSPYLLGVDKGFYREEGLDVEVLEGKGVTSSMQLVASGQDTFTIVDPPSLMLGAAQGMPVRTVAQIYQISPNALISWKDQNITKPSDLVGKVVATLQGDTTTTMLYALLAKNNVQRNAVQIVASDGGTRTQTFLAKRAQAITGFTNDSYIGLAATTNNEVQCFAYSEFGIDTMGDGIAAHKDTIASSPKVVAGFVKASIRAYRYAIENPEEAVASLIKRSPSLKAEVEVAKLKATAPLLETAETKAHGIGYSSKQRWEEAQTLMKDFGGLTKTEADVSVFYTNEFLPKA